MQRRKRGQECGRGARSSVQSYNPRERRWRSRQTCLRRFSSPLQYPFESYACSQYLLLTPVSQECR